MIENFLLKFTDVDFVFSTIAFIAAIGSILSVSEDLANWKTFEKAGLLSWHVSKHRSSFLSRNWFVNKLAFVLEDGYFYFVLLASLVASISLLIFSALGIISSFLIAMLFILRALVMIRSAYGLDGAYQMNLVVLLALTIATFGGIHSKIGSICLWFLAGELILSYFIAGAAKIVSPVWRSSHALNAIFATGSYGHSFIYRIVTKYQILAVVLCWTTMVFELGFVFSFISEHLCIIFCLSGCLFHLFNAIFMGLNTFFFSFLSTYPAVIFCLLSLHR